MGPSGSRLIWRALATLFLGAVAVIGVTAVSSPAGDLVPGRLALDPVAQESGADAEAEALDEDDRPTPEQVEGLPRMVGTPTEATDDDADSPTDVEVEVLGTGEASDDTAEASDDTAEDSDNTDGAGDVTQTEPASQVDTMPSLTG